jgi:hypothetical protein
LLNQRDALSRAFLAIRLGPAFARCRPPPPQTAARFFFTIAKGFPATGCCASAVAFAGGASDAPTQRERETPSVTGKDVEEVLLRLTRERNNLRSLNHCPASCWVAGSLRCGL